MKKVKTIQKSHYATKPRWKNATIPKLMISLYGLIILITIFSMHYNVKSMAIHDQVISLKLALNSHIETNQQLEFKRDTTYSLAKIHQFATQHHMSRPKRHYIVTLTQ